MEHDHTAFGNVEEPLWLCEEPSIAHEHRTLQMVEDPVGSTVSRFSQGLPSHGGVHDMRLAQSARHFLPELLLTG